jgi:hypothetical protein
MTAAMVLAYVGMAFWVMGLISCGILVFSKKSKLFEKIGGCLLIIGVYGFMGMILTGEATDTAIKDKVISYTSPTSIIKTNNITTVLYIEEGKILCNASSSEASFWNSSNIMVRIISGKNIWGNEVDSRYNVVIGEK